MKNNVKICKFLKFSSYISSSQKILNMYANAEIFIQLHFTISQKFLDNKTVMVIKSCFYIKQNFSFHRKAFVYTYKELNLPKIKVIYISGAKYKICLFIRIWYLMRQVFQNHIKSEWKYYERRVFQLTQFFFRNICWSGKEIRQFLFYKYISGKRKVCEKIKWCC